MASPGRHRGARRAQWAPVRTGLLGVSAAVAMGAVAVASGLLPGGNTYTLNGGNESNAPVRAGTLPTSGPSAQGSESDLPDGRGGTPADRGDDRAHAPSTTPSKTPAEPAPSGSDRPGSSSPSRGDGTPGSDGTGGKGHSERPTPPRASTGPSDGPSTDPAPSSDTENGAEQEVLTLVNQERAKAGCQPVSQDTRLARLAQDFSDDMALRDFFDHVDPDGETPWDRADKAGIVDLGGENIARGQATARAVMDSWMDSPGHRANILNCEYKTLGVGAHFAAEGPWWTQDFGF